MTQQEVETAMINCGFRKLGTHEQYHSLWDGVQQAIEKTLSDMEEGQFRVTVVAPMIEIIEDDVEQFLTEEEQEEADQLVRDDMAKPLALRSLSEPWEYPDFFEADPQKRAVILTKVGEK